MKNTKDIEESEEIENANKLKTDQDIMNELAKSDEEFDQNKIVIDDGEDFVEVDGVKIIPFSIKDELKEGHFDKNGSYVPDASDKEEEDMSSSYSSSESEVNEEKARESLVEAIKQLLQLIPPDKNVTDALVNCKNDDKRLSAITDCATNLMYLGITDIYEESIDDLKKKLSQYDKGNK
ncbi:CD2 antigen cytoplasmic tail-binding protein 2 [Histomonas meleagridis]|uniref:CD2 antigen cytoplasmic tail-binding protein 2-like n=1 Tax=Histomonas meleagridis TaxID=135588 RepID=UPI00355A630B|nr:CD2 antigen cytoplasmic tail-binding protein 2 [Histomonas meleagridis]KAH0796641.1 CD2 antigen cytoplasmic tail-binding protein 2-like [Histomonas meleagridis]